MSFKNVDIEAGLRRIADRRIEEAMREGKFSNLAGHGKPLDIEDMPAEEDARLMWWALRLMRQNDFTPDEVRWRKAVDLLRVKLDKAKSEPAVRAVVGEINALVHRINTLGTNALKAPFAPVSEADALARFRARTFAGGGAPPDAS